MATWNLKHGLRNQPKTAQSRDEGQKEGLKLLIERRVEKGAVGFGCGAARRHRSYRERDSLRRVVCFRLAAFLAALFLSASTASRFSLSAIMRFTSCSIRFMSALEMPNINRMSSDVGYGPVMSVFAFAITYLQCNAGGSLIFSVLSNQAIISGFQCCMSGARQPAIPWPPPTIVMSSQPTPALCMASHMAGDCS